MILVDGEKVEIKHPDQALQYGIVTIYQETNLVFELKVAENIFMGRLPLRGRFLVDYRELYRMTQELLNQLDVNFSPHMLVKDLSPAQRQMVEIAKALSISARVIVLDEPTASLTEHEIKVLFEVMHKLCRSGVSIVFITHHLAEVFEAADRVTVMRDGELISEQRVDETNHEKLIFQMVGRQVDSIYSKVKRSTGEPVLQVKDLSGEGFQNVSFELRAGEIVGIFGLIGSGRTEVMLSLFGAEPIYNGRIHLDGSPINIRTPKDAIQAGVVLAPEDRKHQGLILGMPVRANISLPSIWRLSNRGFVRNRLENTMANEFQQKMDIRCPSIETPTLSLSGGNQQKVVISKWLARKPKVLILDEPTRGIDVAGKTEVHRLMNGLAASGVGILMVSSELLEVLGMSDRVLVMRDGKLVAEFSGDDASEEAIMSFAAGHVTDKTATQLQQVS
jgi:ribose transport system ATP-binding protein